MGYTLVQGVVRDLKVTEGYEDLSPFRNIQYYAGVTGIAATVLESSSNSLLLASSRNSAETRMKFFTCFVGEKALKGRFYRVGFQDGEEMEFVVKEVANLFEVHGACSTEKQLIWTLPFQTRGWAAQKRSDLIASIVWALVFALLFSMFFYWKFPADDVAKWHMASEGFFVGFAMVFVLGVVVRRHFYDFSYQATEIFDVFGFVDPENVNLPKNRSKAEKQYMKKTGALYPLYAPLTFRYELPADK